MIFIFAKSLLLTFSIVAAGNLIWTKFLSYNLNGSIINKYLDQQFREGVSGLISFILNFIFPLKIILTTLCFISNSIFIFHYNKKRNFCTV